MVYTTTKLQQLKSYATYQFHTLVKSDELKSADVFKICILETFRWLRGRLSEYKNLPSEIVLPEPEEYDRLMGGGKPGSFREPGTPDLIIPFERTAEDFRKAFESAVEERYFADLGFIRKFHTAAVRAVYAPFRICDFWISGDICYTSEDVRSRNGGGYLHVFHECRTLCHRLSAYKAGRVLCQSHS